MSKYLIHTCKKRLWYVHGFLIPSMTEQGIDLTDIAIYLDENEEGCLESCMKAFLRCPTNEEGTWHLQDDVLICSDFKKKTEMCEEFYNGAIICAYCYSLDGNKGAIGRVRPKAMWYSFPCIYIPNKIARFCADWFYRKAMRDASYGVYIRSKKHDDTLFHIFVEDYCEAIDIINLSPNLVDHIDYLIGGSIINYARVETETPAAYFEEKHLVEELEEKLNDYRRLSGNR